MWHARARHCPLCAGGLVDADIEERTRPRCSECGFVLFANPACAAAGVVLDESGRVLLVRRAIEPYKGFWALPAGYQEIDEGPEAAITREVREEAGVEIEVLGLLDLFFVENDPRKPANVAVFLCRALTFELAPETDDVTDAGWFGLSELPDDIGFDNKQRILGRLEDASGYPRSAWSRLEELLGG